MEKTCLEGFHRFLRDDIPKKPGFIWSVYGPRRSGLTTILTKVKDAMEENAYVCQTFTGRQWCIDRTEMEEIVTKSPGGGGSSNADCNVIILIDHIEEIVGCGYLLKYANHILACGGRVVLTHSVPIMNMDEQVQQWVQNTQNKTSAWSFMLAGGDAN